MNKYQNKLDLIEERDINLSKLAIIVVTLDPEITLLKKQFDSIPNQSQIIVVDNGSTVDFIHEIKRYKANTEIITNKKNVGLATAINQGAKWASKKQYTMLLLLDQDTEPNKNSIEKLMLSYKEVLRKDSRLGCIGPRLLDISTGLTHGFHCIKGLRWVRVYADNNIKKSVKVASLNGSGTLVPTGLFIGLGGLDGSMFIDHLDTDWSFKVLSAGYHLYGIPDITFSHKMGDKSFRFWLLGWKVWPWRSPLRHRYLFRNTVLLLRKGYVPFIWKLWAVIKLLVTFNVHLLTDPQRWSQVKNMLKGIYLGVTK